MCRTRISAGALVLLLAAALALSACAEPVGYAPEGYVDYGYPYGWIDGWGSWGHEHHGSWGHGFVHGHPGFGGHGAFGEHGGFAGHEGGAHGGFAGHGGFGGHGGGGGGHGR